MHENLSVVVGLGRGRGLGKKAHTPRLVRAVDYLVGSLLMLGEDALA